MLALWICTGLAVVSAAPTAGAPTVAVAGLQARPGVTGDTAALLADALTAALRDTGAFSQVISAEEMRQLLTLEQQRQAADCEAASCAAELAGALGVTFIVHGSVGKVGRLWVLNVKLVDARSGVNRSSVSRSIDSADESELLLAIAPAARELAGFLGVAPEAAPAAPVPARSAAAAPSSAGAARRVPPPAEVNLFRQPWGVLLPAGLGASAVGVLGIAVVIAGVGVLAAGLQADLYNVVNLGAAIIGAGLLGAVSALLCGPTLMGIGSVLAVALGRGKMSSWDRVASVVMWVGSGGLAVVTTLLAISTCGAGVTGALDFLLPAQSAAFVVGLSPACLCPLSIMLLCSAVMAGGAGGTTFALGRGLLAPAPAEPAVDEPR